MYTVLFLFSVDCGDNIDRRIRQNISKITLFTSEMYSKKGTWIPKWIFFKRYLKRRLKKLQSQVVERIIFLQNKSRMQATFINYPELPHKTERMVGKSSAVYFETSVMSHAGLRATSLLFWITTTENQTGPIQQTVTFVKFSTKRKEKKKSRPFILL